MEDRFMEVVATVRFKVMSNEENIDWDVDGYLDLSDDEGFFEDFEIIDWEVVE